MKRLAYSILIGAGCALLFFGFSKLLENKREKGLLDVFKTSPSAKTEYYSAELKVGIGSPEDNEKLVEQTKDQILSRLAGSYTGQSFEKLDKNVYRLKANKIFDTTIFKIAITASGKIEFSELLSLNEIYGPISSVDSVLRKRHMVLQQKKLQESKKNPDTSTDKLSVILDQVVPEESPGLARFISFSTGYQDNNGRLRYPADLGYVKTKDTSALNKILTDPENTRLFPENLGFVYGYLGADLYSDDSMLKLFAKKTLDRAFFPFPTGDQIKMAMPEFEPTTGRPMILFEFNSQGAQDWYLMTKRNINKPIAIITNNIVLTAPVVESAIEGGQSRITGDFSFEETQSLCTMILSGELALPATITSAAFKHHSSKKFGLTLIIAILFVVSSAASYGISFLIKPASKP